ncbi:rhodanese-like domain-containing protein [Chloroflexota bacterium]
MRLKNSNILATFLLVICCLGLVAGCVEKVVTETHDFTGQIIQDITTVEANILIQQNRLDPLFIILDVRTPEEFAEGHFIRAINIDFRSENFGGQISELNKNNKYLIYCRSGNRSRGALEMMVGMDFKEVYHLSAGITKWIDEGYPIIR